MPWWCSRYRRWRARRRRDTACAQVDVSSTGSIKTSSGESGAVWGSGCDHLPARRVEVVATTSPLRESRRRGPPPAPLQGVPGPGLPGPGSFSAGIAPMGIRAWLGRLAAALRRLWRGLREGRSLSVAELARRLGVPEDRLALKPAYQPREIPKRSGGTRLLHVPSDDLKDLQRTILRRLLKRLRCHPAAKGFQPGESIVSHASLHAGRAVVVRLDLRDFFPSTGSGRVYQYFRRIGWNRPAARLLTNLCTHRGGLPQGAPTSPRLSNLLNHRLDARLTAMAARLGAHYSRYADDITLS